MGRWVVFQFGWLKSFFAGAGRQVSLVVGLVYFISRSNEVNSAFASSWKAHGNLEFALDCINMA